MKPNRILDHLRRIHAIRHGVVVLVALPILMFLAFQAAVAWWPYPSGIEGSPANGTFILDRNGVPMAARVASDGQWRIALSPDQISPHLLRAMVAVEDARFHEHGGVDWKSALGAIWHDVRHLQIHRGASTLTMQLERLRDPKPRTIFNKFEQAVRAKQLERRATKDTILVEYLNRAPFGGNLIGAGAASWRYFGRPCRDLSLAEAALLAGLPQNPNRLRPDRYIAAATARRNHVLDRMRYLEMIDAKQFADARLESVTAVWHPLPQDADPDALPTYDTLAARYPGQVIRTTLDLEIQRRATKLAQAQIKTLNIAGVAAAVVVLDTQTSECLAAVSYQSIDTKGPHRSVDLTRGSRSTGSTLKPFIYAAAFEAGICSPKTILLDSPAAWAGYAPGNYDRGFRGPMPAADALAESRNIPALVILGKVGVERAVGILESFGFNTIARGHRNYGLSLAIGGAEATPVELAEAYATLGRGGIWRHVVFVREEAMTDRRVMQSRACWQVIAAMSASPRTRAISPEAASLEVAWKTGTSSGHRDAWCAAITPRFTVVVWIGNPQGEAAAALVGLEAAAPLALRLIASLDTVVANWPKIPAAEITSERQAGGTFIAARSVSSLVITSPRPDEQIVLNPELSADRQQVSLEASTDTSGVWWFVDESPVGRERRLWWAPIPGSHRIRVVNGEGRAASIDIHVRFIPRESPQTR